MSKIKMLLLAIIILITARSSIFSMVYDNRVIPLLQRPYISVDDTQNIFAVDYFMATGSKALDHLENEIGIPELYGLFDQGKLADAFVAAGRPNPLRSEWQNREIPWAMDGKIQAQAVTFLIHKKIVDWLAIGFSWLFMRTNSRQEFRLKSNNLFLGPGDRLELDDLRRAMFSQLRLAQNHTAQLGFGDIDCYLRFGNVWDYTLKFRSFDVGARLGLLIPTGQSRDINEPASIPFGGNGHWGIYGTLDGLFELKEDMKFGFFARLSKRFKRTNCQRMPVLGEPRIFGATVGQATINPGLTFIFSPYIVLENLRKGMGVSVQYHLTSHRQDSWTDVRLDKTIPVDLCQVEELSEWGSDYFTLHLFYDFGKAKPIRSFDPIISFRWDVPAMLFITNRIAKTHRISIGVEFAF